MRAPQLGIALLLAWALPAPAAERILAFHSDIEVHADASMTVTETLRVQAQGAQIKRGIYRDFPTQYRDRVGNRYQVGFEVLGVTRDGRPEPFHTDRRSNGVRVYIGRSDVHLRPGEYTYTLSYRTDRQLGFFAAHDELYWNVTGTDWVFPIEHASARVRLPAIPESALRLSAYTGPFGARGQDYVARLEAGGGARFETTRALPPGHGLTIVLEWPKGHVSEPTLADELGWILRDNRALGALALSLLALLAYYALAWLKVGRDPQAGVIVPQYVPPKGYSPASMRFIRRMGYDQKTFASALVNLAVKGYLRITESDGQFTLERAAGNDVELAPGEQAIAKQLFSAAPVVVLRPESHRVIGSALEAHKHALRRDYEKIHFLTNSGYLVPGILLSLATLLASILAAPGAETVPTLFLTAWLAVWSIACFALIGASVDAWRAVASTGVAQALKVTLFAIPFLGFEGFGLWAFSQTATVSLGAGVIVVALVNLLFYQLLKAPTLAGRKLLDKIEGFRHYLQVAEGGPLRGRRLPRETLDLFEIYLPYALALDVENEWSERFAATIAAAERERGHAYDPAWYRSSHGYRGIPYMTSALGSSLGSAIAASARAPGSSSGGGGGGSSGGGGGGGGGGGW